MIDRSAPPGLRLQFLSAVVLLIAAGCFALWMALFTLAPALRGSAVHAPMVEFRPLYVTGLPLAGSFFALAMLALLPKRPSVGSRVKGGPRAIGAANILFGVAVGSVLLAIVAAPIARLIVSRVMGARGYVICPASEAERRPPIRWVQPGVRCP